MKSLVLTGGLLLSSTAFAETIVKSCQTTLGFEGQSIETLVEIVDRGRDLVGRTTQAGATWSNQAMVFDAPVRAGLQPQTMESIDETDSDDLNLGETLIQHAMTITAIPEMNQKAGLDLSQVRSVKVFQIVDEEVNIGMTAIVEAKDAQGKTLGSFLGGFLVSPCR